MYCSLSNSFCIPKTLSFPFSLPLTRLSIPTPCRAAEAWRLLSDHGAAQPALRHTLWPAPALRGADRPGVRERLRGAGHAGWQGTCHWRRYAHMCTCLPIHTHRHTLKTHGIHPPIRPPLHNHRYLHIPDRGSDWCCHGNCHTETWPGHINIPLTWGQHQHLRALVPAPCFIYWI